MINKYLLQRKSEFFQSMTIDIRTILERYCQHIERLHKGHDYHDHVRMLRLDRVPNGVVLQLRLHLERAQNTEMF